MRVTAQVLFIALMVLAGCSDEKGSSEPADSGYCMFAGGEVLSIVPDHFSIGSQVTIAAAFESRYRGCGHIEIVGHGAGSDIGMIVSPVDSALGRVSLATAFPSGIFDLTLTIEITSTLPDVGLSIYAVCDSLLVNGEMVPWDSPDGYAVYRDDLPQDCCAFLSNQASVYVHVPQVPGTAYVVGPPRL